LLQRPSSSHSAARCTSVPGLRKFPATRQIPPHRGRRHGRITTASRPSASGCSNTAAQETEDWPPSRLLRQRARQDTRQPADRPGLRPLQGACSPRVSGSSFLCSVKRHSLAIDCFPFAPPAWCVLVCMRSQLTPHSPTTDTQDPLRLRERRVHALPAEQRKMHDRRPQHRPRDCPWLYRGPRA